MLSLNYHYVYEIASMQSLLYHDNNEKYSEWRVTVKRGTKIQIEIFEEQDGYNSEKFKYKINFKD